MCGYMGLDSMGSSLMETQKLSFEEQPDAKVKPAAPWGCGEPAHAGAWHHPTPWDVASSPSSGCHGPSFLAIAPRSCSATPVWHMRQPEQLGGLPCLAKSPIFLQHHLFGSAAPWQASCQKLHSSLSPGTFSP